VPGKILKTPGRDDKGYVQLQLYLKDNSRGWTVKLHRMVALAFLGPRGDGMTVNHIDGNKENNALSNLEYITNYENAMHARRLGLVPPTPRGKDNWASGAKRPQKLTVEKVQEIRQRLAAGERARDIAPEYGVHEMTIGEVKRREIWAWV
jgi:hypothetical protein